MEDRCRSLFFYSYKSRSPNIHRVFLLTLGDPVALPWFAPPLTPIRTCSTTNRVWKGWCLKFDTDFCSDPNLFNQIPSNIPQKQKNPSRFCWIKRRKKNRNISCCDTKKLTKEGGHKKQMSLIKETKGVPSQLGRT